MATLKTSLFYFILLSASFSSCVAAENLIKNGEFNQGDRWQAPPPNWSGNGSSGFAFWKDGSDGDGIIIENGNHFMILNESDTYQDVLIEDKNKGECILKYREGVHPGATGEVFLQYLDNNKNVLVSKSNAITYPFTYAEGLLSSTKTLMGGVTPDNIKYVRVKTTGTKAVGYAKIDDIELTCSSETIINEVNAVCPVGTKLDTSVNYIPNGDFSTLPGKTYDGNYIMPGTWLSGGTWKSDAYYQAENQYLFDRDTSNYNTENTTASVFNKEGIYSDKAHSMFPGNSDYGMGVQNYLLLNGGTLGKSYASWQSNDISVDANAYYVYVAHFSSVLYADKYTGAVNARLRLGYKDGNWNNLSADFNEIPRDLDLSSWTNESTAGDQWHKYAYLIQPTSNTISLRVEDGIKNTVYGDDYAIGGLGLFKCAPLGSSISGNVFKDTNDNDSFDSGELGIANISVWLQLINVDGSIDSLKVFAETDAKGNYRLSSLADGRYQVYVDVTDEDLPIDHIIGSDNPLVITIKGTDITNADFPFDETTCSAFSGEVSQTALVVPPSLKTKDHIIIPSSSISPLEGHLRAYEVDASGAPKSVSVWDAATRMTLESRTNKLYSSDSSGTKIRFKDLKENAFGTSSNNYNDILEYTLDPSYNDGKYLSGRKNNTFLGGISRHNGIVLLNNSMDTFRYLDDTDYQAYYTNTVALRDTRVLVSSDDGFLYAFDDKSGDLAWAWIPPSLVTELGNYKSFQSHHFMRGQIDVVDLKASNKYQSYIVGSYKGGLGHYVLKLDEQSASKSNLQSVVWDSDNSKSFVSSPNHGQMEYFRDDQGETYISYVMTKANNKSTLFIRSLTSNAVELQIELNFNATSTPFVMIDFKRHNAPARKTLYLGDDSGNFYTASLLNKEGTLASSDSITAELEGSSSVLSSLSDDPIRFIGVSMSSSDRRYYLRVQSDTNITIFKYYTNEALWKRVWASHENGSDQWAEDGTHKENPSVVQQLPLGAFISDNAYIVGDSVVLPVNVPDAIGKSCYGKAFYYLYKLTDGSFPQNSFFKADNSSITGNIALGNGYPRRLVLSDILDKDVLAGFGHADQIKDSTTGVNEIFFIRDSLTTGIRSWRILEEESTSLNEGVYPTSVNSVPEKDKDSTGEEYKP